MIRRKEHGRGWLRDDRVHIAGPHDESPVHTTYPTGYDSDCGWCWLNATHSVDEHAARLAERAAS